MWNVNGEVFDVIMSWIDEIRQMSYKHKSMLNDHYYHNLPVLFTRFSILL